MIVSFKLPNETNGSVKAIITSDLLTNCKLIDGKQQYPVKFFGEAENVPVIIQNGNHFNLTVGQTTNDLEEWTF